MQVVCFGLNIAELVLNQRKLRKMRDPTLWRKNMRSVFLLVLIIVWTKLFTDDISSNLAPQALTDISIYEKLMKKEINVLEGYKLRAEEWTEKIILMRKENLVDE
jgi:hypothetical protein